MAFLSSFYPQPVVAGTTEGTYAEGDDARIVGALPAATAGSGSVLASGSNTARTLSARFGEVFHVDDYGAKGDWSGTTGTDDTAAIQAAINAAVAAGGGTVRFSPSKTYYVNGRTQNPVGQTAGFHHLGIFNATTSTKLRIDGNGASLYSNRYSTSTPDWTDFIYVCSRFDTIDINGLSFERAPHVITTTGAPTCGIRMNFFDSNISRLFKIYNCRFIDCRLPLIINPTGNIYSYLDRLLFLDVSNCEFLHPRGSSITNTAGGNQTVNLSRWVKVAHFHNCYFDGCVGGVLPNDVRWPVDGFSYVGATNNIYSNCFFTNNWIETILSAQAQDANISVTITGLDINSNIITQPLVGDSITVKVRPNSTGVAIVGNNYILMGLGAGNSSSVSGGLAHSHVGPIGSFKLTGFTGSYAGEVGATLTLQRINSDDLGIDPKALDFPDGETYIGDNNSNLLLVDPEISKQATTNISNCVFSYPNRVRTSNKSITGSASDDLFTCNNHLFSDGYEIKFFDLVGGSNISNNTSYFVRDSTQNTFKVSSVRGGSAVDFTTNITSGTAVQYFPMGQPAIYAGRGTETTISNCTFVGATSAVISTDQFHWGPTKPTNICNNSFYIKNQESTASLQDSLVAFITTNNCTFVGNSVTVDKSQNITYILFIGANGTTVTGNTVYVGEQSNVTLPTRFINWNNGAPSGGWKCIVENNFISGLDNYGNNASTSQVMGPFMGSLRGSIATSGSQEIKIASRLISPDKSEWLVRITNNGELEVSK